MLARLKDALKGMGGEWVVSFTTTAQDVTDIFREFDGKDVNIEIKRAYKRRSLDANAYAWVLIDKIAEKTGEQKTAVYRQAIREIGGVTDVICVINKAVDRLRTSWERNGIGWQTDTMPSKTPGCTNVVLYYGSSVYDSKQMSQLIDSLVQDAEQLGIPTISPKEAEEMISKWGGKVNGNTHT